MPPDQTTLEGLREIREWNRLFLTYVRDQLTRARQPTGLPAGVGRALETASPDTIERLAEFPQALFRIRLDALDGSCVMAPGGAETDPAQRALQLTLLVSARALCRKSAYAARLYLRLNDFETRRLAELPFGDLPALALSPDLITCAYSELGWMWRELLAASRPERKRKLLLLGLQPRMELNAPLSVTR